MRHFDVDLDVRGLKCPLPILRTKKSLAEMTSGQVLRVLATDVNAAKDFQAFAKQTGNTLLDSSETWSESDPENDQKRVPLLIFYFLRK